MASALRRWAGRRCGSRVARAGPMLRRERVPHPNEALPQTGPRQSGAGLLQSQSKSPDRRHATAEFESMKLDTFAPGLSGQAALSSVSLSAQRKHARQKATMPRKLTDGDRRLCAKNGREHLQHACTDAFDASSTRRVRGATAPAYTNSKRNQHLLTVVRPLIFAAAFPLSCGSGRSAYGCDGMSTEKSGGPPERNHRAESLSWPCLQAHHPLADDDLRG